jgi:hypothetical protein
MPWDSCLTVYVYVKKNIYSFTCYRGYLLHIIYHLHLKTGRTLLTVSLLDYILKKSKNVLCGNAVVYMVAAPIGLCSLPLLYVAEFFPSEVTISSIKQIEQ